MKAREISDALAGARRSAGRGLREVGNAANVSVWERGLRSPTLAHAVDWAAALGYELTLVRTDFPSAPLAGAESAVPPGG